MCVCVSLSVPFRETPSYTNRRRVTVGGGTLTSSRSLLRSASDNNLNGAETGTAHSPVPSLRSLPPLAPPGGEAAADGSLQSTGSSRSSHSRSPSLHRVSEEPDTHVLRRHPTYTHGRGRLRWAPHLYMLQYSNKFTAGCLVKLKAIFFFFNYINKLLSSSIIKVIRQIKKV